MDFYNELDVANHWLTDAKLQVAVATRPNKWLKTNLKLAKRFQREIYKQVKKYGPQDEYTEGEFRRLIELPPSNIETIEGYYNFGSPEDYGIGSGNGKSDFFSIEKLYKEWGYEYPERKWWQIWKK